MIGKQEFVDLIQGYYEQNKNVDKLCEIFNNSFDNPIIEWGFRMFDNLINAYFDEIGADWINYYLYENPNKCYYQDNVEIPLETINDLWKLIKKHRK